MPKNAHKKSFRVLIGDRSHLNKRIPEKTLLIVPAISNWNDFGHHILVNYKVQDDELDNPIYMIGYIGFLTDNSGSTYEEGYGHFFKKEACRSQWKK